MREELENKLYEKYPKLFAQKDLPMSISNMCFGCCVGDGWYNILHAMCGTIQDYVDRKTKEDPEFQQIEFSQVKEKFGELRIYCNYYEPVVESCVAFAERLSAVTCEECGTPGKIRGRGWLTCRCDSCDAEYQKKRTEQ